VSSIVKALQLSSEVDRGPSQVAVDFAQQFKVQTVWDQHWLSFWKDYFGQ